MNEALYLDKESFPLEEIYEPPELKEIFDNLVSEMPLELLELIKNFVEENLSKLIGIEGKLEISVVIDANAVISQAISYIKKERMPLIIELSKTPFVKLYAPPSIYDETVYDEEKLKEIAKKKKVPISVLKEKMEEILSHIEIIAPEGYEEYKKARELVGWRDPKDIDYVWLYFSINAHGIVSSDKDITETIVRTWKNMGPIKHLEVTLAKGSISFSVMTLGGSAILDFVFRVLAAVIGTILGILKIVWGNIKQLINWIIGGFSKLSDEMKALILIATIILGYKFKEEIRESLEKVKEFIDRAKEFLNQLKDFISNILQKLSENLLIKLLMSLLKYSMTLIQLYRQINLSNIGVGGLSS
ncbi:hypothetical protein E3E22_08310 [Thermococcus sp. MV5]|uniref:PIN domain-containing protein n=1 Tax=Thermococcus sp. MV5 TaxID=1638272 RepID=UPI00143AB762|nr:PIN domain-containing protein [Thermococcus sp. MV5]NJE26617.1 hypothetical protein [Thermococcus sp. MV5]